MERRAVTAIGCHDALSARVAEHSGFEIVQVSGFGLAGAMIAKPDVGLLPLADILYATEKIVQAVDIPVMADIDTGGGSAINAMHTLRQVIAMGAAGANIEDQVFPKRCGHLAGKEVIPAGEMAGKVRACSDIRERLDRDFIINARTDSFATHGLDEAIRRCNLYLAAGADMAFIDGISDIGDMRKAVNSLDGPLSVNLMDGVTGVRTTLVPIPELKEMGVGRVSIPVASILAVHKVLMEFFAALKSSPDGILPGETRWVSGFKDYTDFIGLREYRELEKKYLP